MNGTMKSFSGAGWVNRFQSAYHRVNEWNTKMQNGKTVAVMFQSAYHRVNEWNHAGQPAIESLAFVSIRLSSRQ